MLQQVRVRHANVESWVIHAFLTTLLVLTMPTSSVMVRDPIYTAVKTAATERPMLNIVTIWPCTCFNSLACIPKANLSFSEATTELTMAAYSRFCCSCLNRSRNTCRASFTYTMIYQLSTCNHLPPSSISFHALQGLHPLVWVRYIHYYHALVHGTIPDLYR